MSEVFNQSISRVVEIPMHGLREFVPGFTIDEQNPAPEPPAIDSFVASAQALAATYPDSFKEAISSAMKRGKAKFTMRARLGELSVDDGEVTVGIIDRRDSKDSAFELGALFVGLATDYPLEVTCRPRHMPRFGVILERLHTHTGLYAPKSEDSDVFRSKPYAAEFYRPEPSRSSFAEKDLFKPSDYLSSEFEFMDSKFRLMLENLIDSVSDNPATIKERDDYEYDDLFIFARTSPISLHTLNKTTELLDWIKRVGPELPQR